MNSSNLILTVIFLIALSVPAGFCNYKNEHNMTDNPQEWLQFKNEAELNINVDEERIADFKVKIKTTGKESKAKYEKEVTVLEQKISVLKKKISEYKYEGIDKLEEFKLGFNHELEVVEKALE
jgi:hypothetical protein